MQYAANQMRKKKREQIKKTIATKIYTAINQRNNKTATRNKTEEFLNL